MTKGRHKCDVLIVGAGPAGCAAGFHLARSGAKVVVLERHSFPRQKVCGGLLTDNARVLAEELTGCPLAAKMSPSTSSLFQVYRRTERLNAVKATQRMHGIDRLEFDHALFRAAADAGCEIIEKARVERLDAENGLAALKNGTEITFCRLIGADGVNSLVGRSIGLTQAKRLVAPAFQLDIPAQAAKAAGLDKGNSVILGYVGYGWGWAFEKADRVTIGLAGIEIAAGELKARLIKMLDEFGLRRELEKSKIVGSPVPFGSYLKKPARGGTLLTGDAAGFAEPVSGEGIQFALLSGKLAARAIAENPAHPTQNYLAACAAQVLPELKEARLFRPLVFSRFLQPATIALIVRNDANFRMFLGAVAGETSYHKCLFGALTGHR